MTPAAVSIRDDARPDDAAHVRLDAFDGPLALLLTLIEQRQLDVLTVPLGDLASAYLEELASLPGQRLPHISAFVSVCSQLIVIKSRALLPRAPAAPADASVDALDPEEELRRRLLVYRTYRDAAHRLSARLEAGLCLFVREPATATAAGLAGARPGAGPPMDAALLVASLTRSAQLVLPPPPAPEIVARTVTLEERAAVIRRALRRAPQVVLQDLLRDVTDRVVLAVTFLAMLELVKGHELTVEQDEPWGPIVCRRWTGREAPSPPDVANGAGDGTGAGS